jgi:hypothetical protein
MFASRLLRLNTNRAFRPSLRPRRLGEDFTGAGLPSLLQAARLRHGGLIRILKRLGCLIAACCIGLVPG